MNEIDGDREGGMKRRIFLTETRKRLMIQDSGYGNERNKLLMNVEAEAVASWKARVCIEEK